MDREDRTRTSIAIAGLGTVGRVVASHLCDMPAYEITAISTGREDRGREFLASLGIDESVELVPIEELVDHAEVIVECAPPALLPEIAGPVVRAGKTLVTISVGALLDSWGLVDEAERHGGRILVPSGALLALDAVQAAALGTINWVNMVTRKPPAGLVDTPFVVDNDIDLTDLKDPVQLFKGSVRDAIVGFPTNLNVAVALSLAGIGPDRTQIEVWADPSVDRNTHHIEVESDSAHMEFSIANIWSDNYTSHAGRITALSVVALLRKRVSHLRIGT